MDARKAAGGEGAGGEGEALLLYTGPGCEQKLVLKSVVALSELSGCSGGGGGEGGGAGRAICVCPLVRRTMPGVVLIITGVVNVWLRCC